MKKRLMVSLVPAIACCAFAAPALAATPEAVSENWAGYVATPNEASGFSGVSAQWTQPTVDCSTTQQAAYSAYWVGIGGGGFDLSTWVRSGMTATIWPATEAGIAPSLKTIRMGTMLGVRTRIIIAGL